MLTRIYNPSKKERGFTLIELLVVIIIIGILAAIAIPLFLDQRKLAVDASVKSDVRNTATQVQTWQINNPGVVAADATAYTAAGGKVVSTGSNTVGVTVATDGSYLVCGYVSNAKQYTAANAAYVFDSSTGRFGTGTCTGGIVGGGSSSSPAPSTSTPTPSATTTTPPAQPALTITTASLPNAVAGSNYSASLAVSNGPATSYGATGLPTGLSIDTSTGTITGTPSASGTYNVHVTATASGNRTAAADYTVLISDNVLQNAGFESGPLGSSNPGPAWFTYGDNVAGTTWGSPITDGNGGSFTAHGGTKMGGFNPGAQGHYGSILQDAPTTITYGHTYTMGAWVRAQTAGTTAKGTMYLTEFNSSGAATGIPGSGTTYSVSSDKWTYISIQGVAPGNGTTLRWQIVGDNNSGPGVNLAIDDAFLGEIK